MQDIGDFQIIVLFFKAFKTEVKLVQYSSYIYENDGNWLLFLTRYIINRLNISWLSWINFYGSGLLYCKKFIHFAILITVLSWLQNLIFMTDWYASNIISKRILSAFIWYIHYVCYYFSKLHNLAINWCTPLIFCSIFPPFSIVQYLT